MCAAAGRDVHHLRPSSPPSDRARGLQPDTRRHAGKVRVGEQPCARRFWSEPRTLSWSVPITSAGARRRHFQLSKAATAQPLDGCDVRMWGAWSPGSCYLSSASGAGR